MIARSVSSSGRLSGSRAAESSGSGRIGWTAPEPAAATVLQVTGLDAFYGHRQVLYGIHLAVPPDTCVAIVGESGSGKTTPARCIAGLHTNWTGEVRYGGQPLTPGIRRRPKDVLRGIQYVFQNPYASLNPRRTVGGLVAQPIETFAGRRRARR